MLLGNSKKELRQVSGLSKQEKSEILSFFQGATYIWCKLKPNEWFSVRSLMGGTNREWSGTPLYVLYQKYKTPTTSVEDAVSAAGIDAGWLLKEVLAKDTRNFQRRDGYPSVEYLWVQD